MSSATTPEELGDESELVGQIAAGSPAAFAQLVRCHQAAVRWCLSRYVRDAATVDDLAQEVFLAAYQRLTGPPPLPRLRPWLLGVARNMAREHLRAALRRRHREQGPLALQLAQWRLDQCERELLQPNPGPDTLAALQDCLRRLAPESRRVVEEHYFERQTLEAIAARQNRSGGSVRMLLLRVRNALRTCLDEKRVR